MGQYDRLSQTENDRCISLTRPSLGLPVVSVVAFVVMVEFIRLQGKMTAVARRE